MAQSDTQAEAGSGVAGMKVVVCGGTGPVGRHVCQQLVVDERVQELVVFEYANSSGELGDLAADLDAIDAPKCEVWMHQMGPGQCAVAEDPGTEAAFTGAQIVLFLEGRSAANSQEVGTFRSNVLMMDDLAKTCEWYCPKAVLAIAVEPLHRMVLVASTTYGSLGLSSQQIVGINSVANMMVNGQVQQEAGTGDYVSVPVVGCHMEGRSFGLLPLFSQDPIAKRLKLWQRLAVEKLFKRVVRKDSQGLLDPLVKAESIYNFVNRVLRNLNDYCYVKCESGVAMVQKVQFTDGTVEVLPTEQPKRKYEQAQFAKIKARLMGRIADVAEPPTAEAAAEAEAAAVAEEATTMEASCPGAARGFPKLLGREVLSSPKQEKPVGGAPSSNAAATRIRSPDPVRQPGQGPAAVEIDRPSALRQPGMREDRARRAAEHVDFVGADAWGVQVMAYKPGDEPVKLFRALRWLQIRFRARMKRAKKQEQEKAQQAEKEKLPQEEEREPHHRQATEGPVKQADRKSVPGSSKARSGPAPHRRGSKSRHNRSRSPPRRKSPSKVVSGGIQGPYQASTSRGSPWIPSVTTACSEQLPRLPVQGLSSSQSMPSCAELPLLPNVVPTP